jgi:hypothetical protein
VSPQGIPQAVAPAPIGSPQAPVQYAPQYVPPMLPPGYQIVPVAPPSSSWLASRTGLATTIASCISIGVGIAWLAKKYLWNDEVEKEKVYIEKIVSLTWLVETSASTTRSRTKEERGRTKGVT